MKPLEMCAALAGPLGLTELLESIRDALNTGPRSGEVLTVLVGAVLLIAVIALAARYLNPENRSRARQQVDIFTHAADVLRLTRQEREDVVRVAGRAAVSTPASLLLSPANLALGAERALRDAADPRLRERLNQLCVKLFGASLPDRRGLADAGSGS
jgi:hypothetical protein